MATRRRRAFTPRGPAPSDAHVYAEFMAALLNGDAKATALDESRDREGKLTLTYAEPDAARGADSTRGTR